MLDDFVFCDYVIQDVCWQNRCEEAQDAGAERGPCACPCHDLADPESVADFARGLRGEDGPQR